jgi:hypothetical protein
MELIDQSPRSVAFLYESGQMQEEMVLPSSGCRKEDGAQGVWSGADKDDRKKKKSQVGNLKRRSEFESDLDCDSEDTGQQKRWLEFLETNHAQFEEEKHLLRAMKLLDDDQDQECEGQELSKETVAAIEVAKGIDQKILGRTKSKKTNDKVCGPILVERNRRRQNDGTSMLQKAMELKKRRI